MYITVHLPYKIGKEAEMAYDTETNAPEEAYAELRLKRCKPENFSEEKYRKLHEENRTTLAEMCDCDVKYVTPISGKEYEENAGLAEDE